MAEASIGISVRKIASLAALAIGGIWLLFILWKLRSYQEHSKAFHQVCGELAPDLSANGRSELCRKLQEKYFKNVETPKITVGPSAFGAPVLPGDERTKIYLFQNPRLFLAQTFCDFVLSSDAKLEKTEIKDYVRYQGVFLYPPLKPGYAQKNLWKTKEGSLCREYLKDKADVDLEPLSVDLKNEEKIIAINLAAFAAKAKNEGEVTIAVRRVLNRERIRRLLAVCPEFNDWAEYEWQRLTPSAKKAYYEQGPNSRWEDPLEAPKMFAELRFQNRPDEALLNIGTCSFP